MGEFSRKNKLSRKDIITDLPESIVETILTKLPIRDAVRTSILSSEWRNKWTTLTQLVFDDGVIGSHDDREHRKEKLINFIMRFLLLHDSPIHKFVISSNYLDTTSDIVQWLLFLQRKDVKELKLKIWYDPIPLTPSHIFSFQKLTSLALYGFKLELPSRFEGFPFLKNLSLKFLYETRAEAIENLISGCPLLESLKFTTSDDIALTARAPNLKYLSLVGTIIDAYLYTPHLATIYAKLYCNLVFQGIGEVPITYDCLKYINIENTDFAEMGVMFYLHPLLLKSPNLVQITIVGEERRSKEDADLDFWEKEYPSNFIFKQVKTVNISNANGKPHEMAFLKFVIGRSPILELMSISPSKCVELHEKMDMVTELLQFRRASVKAEIKFIEAEN